MNPRPLVLAAAWLALAAAAGADTILQKNGPALSNVTVKEMTAQDVTYDQAGARNKIGVNEIRAIRFADEPTRLRTAWSALDAGRYEDAVEALQSIDSTTVDRAEIKQEIAFLTALAKSRVALSIADVEAIKAAGKGMHNFVSANSNSFHFFDACEIVGDLLVASGNHAAAQQYFIRVAAAPWPEYKMRAGVALGGALLAEGKAAEALASFQSVLDNAEQSEAADRQRLAANLGKAQCLAETGKHDEAVTLVQGVIDKAGPEEVDLHARAYNALGLAHKKAGRNKDAILAFLHVHLIYFHSASEHIEALENLVTLWNAIQKPERADEAATILRDRYHRASGSN